MLRLLPTVVRFGLGVALVLIALAYMVVFSGPSDSLPTSSAEELPRPEFVYPLIVSALVMVVGAILAELDAANRAAVIMAYIGASLAILATFAHLLPLLMFPTEPPKWATVKKTAAAMPWLLTCCSIFVSLLPRRIVRSDISTTPKS